MHGAIASGAGFDTANMAAWMSPTHETKIERVALDIISPRPDPVSFVLPHPAAMVASVGQCGILEPLLLRPVAGDRFEVVQGMVRLGCAYMAHLTHVPAVVRELTDEQALICGSWTALMRHGATPLAIGQFIAAAQAMGVEDSTLDQMVVSIPLVSHARGHRRPLAS